MQFCRSGLVEGLWALQRGEGRRDAFCYEHFYVIYCKFWELDEDHDLLLSTLSFQHPHTAPFPFSLAAPL